jgi:hypothetical protein
MVTTASTIPVMQTRFFVAPLSRDEPLCLLFYIRRICGGDSEVTLLKTNRKGKVIAAYISEFLTKNGTFTTMEADPEVLRKRKDINHLLGEHRVFALDEAASDALESYATLKRISEWERKAMYLTDSPDSVGNSQWLQVIDKEYYEQ